MLIKYSYIQIITLIISYLLSAQSFDIYDSSLKLDNWSYNFNENKHAHYFLSSPKSVKLEHTTNELLDPIIKINSSERLKLSFDILSKESSTYGYTFIHCNAQWQHSDITQSEYLDGFPDNYIETYEYSFNTLSPYVHYECVFPNDNVSFKTSGNYIILVYDIEKNIPIITQRFMIHEDMITINMNVKKATLAKDMKDKQEIDFIIENYQRLNIVDPHNELEIIIQKNDDWNNLIRGCTPSFIHNNKLEYDYQGENSFRGGSEYRDFDIKSLRYYGKNIRNIEQKNIQGVKLYSVTLYNDNIKYTEEYKFKYDLNGKYVLSISENKNKDTEGDYALVKFSLNTEKIESGDIYIYGELTNWNILKEAKMTFNQKDKRYYGFLYLKQGYYNYQYVINNNNIIKMMGGNYHETRNQYSIYVYYRPPWARYDRLVGLSKSTSNALN